MHLHSWSCSPRWIETYHKFVLWLLVSWVWNPSLVWFTSCFFSVSAHYKFIHVSDLDISRKKCDVWNWNCCTPSISVGLVLRCAFFWWWISHFTTSWEIFQVSDVYLTVCLKLHTSQGCFCPQTFFRDTKLNMLSWNSLASGLHYQLALSAGVFQALWLIVLVVFVPWINHLALYLADLFWVRLLIWY